MAGEDDLPTGSTAARLIELKSLRTSTKGSITRVKTYLNKKGPALGVEELECRLGILEAYYKQLLGVQAIIDKICPESETEANASFIADLEDSFVETKSNILSYLAQHRQNRSFTDLPTSPTITHVSNRLRREIKIPQFNGKYSEFPKFNAIFKKLVGSDNTLLPCEKLLVLKENLGPKPLASIIEFDDIDPNYEKALSRLQQIYDKKALMFEEHVSALFNMPKIGKGSASSLRQLVDTTNTHLCSMLSIGNFENIVNAFLMHLVMNRVDFESRVKWEEAVEYKELSAWEACSEVLVRRCQTLEARELKLNTDDCKPAYATAAKQRNQHSTLIVSKIICDLCHQIGHPIEACARFIKMTVRQRYGCLKGLQLCFLCLRGGHSKNECNNEKCKICEQLHHEKLHRFIPENNGKSLDGGQETMAKDSRATLHTSRINGIEAEVFMETAVVLIKDRQGLFQPGRVILDFASQINLMCEKFARRIPLPVKSCMLSADGVGGNSTVITKKAQALVKSRINDFETSLEFYLLPAITEKKPVRFVDVSKWKMPKNIQLADPKFNVPGGVDLLIGAELFLELLSIGRIKLGADLPCLQKTVLGWVVSGAAKSEGRVEESCASLIYSKQSLEEENNLESIMERFWSVEEISEKKQFLTDEEKECERIFESTVQREPESGRFIVKIPFKNSVKQLGESHTAAERRFRSLEKRLKKNVGIQNAYTSFMNEYLTLGHMDLVKIEDMKNVKYFAPHQYVLRPESTTTKLRVVFDCSSKTDTKLSLNDVMLKGPVVQDDLLSIVMRFRGYKFSLTADVEKIYRQVWVTEEDSRYQAILWRNSEDEPLKAFRLRTVTYGTASAPYLATRCLMALADLWRAKYPVASSKVLNDFYMDDLISGADTEEDMKQLYAEINEILDSGGFSLRKWHSNNAEFLKGVPLNKREEPKRVNNLEIIKT